MVNSYSEDIIKLILNEYQKMFVEIGTGKIEENGIRYGIPPKSIIVKFHDAYSPKKIKIGNILGAWRVYFDNIEKLDDLNCEPVLEPKDGMYFNEGRGLFTVRDKNNKLLLEWIVGPRYGRGFVYSIIYKDLNKLELVRDKLIWMS